MDNPMTCPICGRAITENDKLLVRWHGPRNWWVTFHYRRVTDPANEAISLTEHDGQWKVWCAEADIQGVVSRDALVTNKSA